MLKILIPLMLAGFFGWFMFSKIPIATILPYFKSADYSYILFGVFFGLLSHLSRAYRWKFLLEPMGYKVKFPNSIMAVFVTYLANYGIPRSGEVLRAAALTNYENVPFEKGFGTIVAERIADLIVMLGIIVFTLIFQFEFIYELLKNAFQPIKLVLAGIFVIVLFGVLFLYIKKSTSKIALKIRTFLNGLAEGLLSVFKMKNKWAFIFHTLFIWAMYILMFYVTTFALDELQAASVGAVIVAFIAASFTIAATNGGVFFYPAAVLGAFLLYGLPKDASYAFGWIIWASQTLMIFVFGTLSFIFLPIYNRKRISENRE
ncbi:lysylphosphatidylglycerol synthase transmembrane domain-containing protein [Mariniflexile ostreae]|uniref:Lysylphosphatidylglycerol synthase transmembrane domain-containing protein n=1 Tax=Mariniflexile ostreae TaxID=1520892 RepID=A0ABV5F7R3_9FLAO